jgi:PAS domain S-box-containing protein
MVGLGLLSVIGTTLALGDAPLTDPFTWLILAASAALMPAYALSRTRHYPAAAAWTAVLITVTIFAAIALFGAEVLNLLGYLVLPVLFSSLFLSTRASAAIVMLGVACTLYAPLLVPSASLIFIVSEPLSFFLITSALILMVARQRELLERDRATVLAEANQRLRDEMTERERAVEALQVAELRYRSLVEQLPAATYVTSLADISRIGGHKPIEEFEYISPQLAAMLGVPLEEAPTLRAGWLDRIHPDDQEFVRADALRFSLTGKSLPLEYRLVARDGRVVWVQDQAQTVQGTTGEVLFVQGLLLDITSRKQAEQALAVEHTLLALRVEERTAELRQANLELERAARLKDEFLSSMSHELRTPLNAILGYTEMVLEECYGPVTQRQAKALSTIEASGRHLLALIADILDLAKIGAGKLDIERQAVSVVELCEGSIQFITPAAKAKEQRVHIIIDPAVRKVTADERRLRQILINLLSNAVKFTHEGGDVGLAVEAGQDGAVRFKVWDTGIGIAPEDLPRLFQPFTQLDSRLNRRYSGTGLGLALVSRLTELHRGEVAVESEPGKGSSFTVTLPNTEC